MSDLSIFYCFAISLSISLLIVLSKPLHERLSADTLQGDQKFHQGIVPRVGGLAIFFSLILTYFLLFTDSLFFTILISGLPVFITGLLEDIFKTVSAKHRLLAAIISATLFIYLSGYHFTSVDIYFFDMIFDALFLFPILTIIAVAALSNAINIIDGFYGLASGSSGVMALSITWLALEKGDSELAQMALFFVAALAGFLVLNFPKGLLFLGDAGAYLCGFLLGIFAILLVERNAEVSPLVLLVTFSYPITELLFSIFRKTFRKGHRPDRPDKVHFHMLVYRSFGRKLTQTKLYQNSATGALMLLFCSIGPLLIILFPLSKTIALGCFFLIAVAYLLLYKRMSLN